MERQQQESFEEFRRRLGDVFYPLETRLPRGETFAIADFSSRRAGTFRLTSSALVHDVPIAGERRWRNISPDTPDEFVLISANSSMLAYNQFHRDAEIEPGDLMLLDARNPYRYERRTAGEVVCYHLPGSLVRQVIPTPEDLCALPIRARSGIGAAMRCFADLIWLRSQEIDEDERRSLFGHLAALLPSVMPSAGSTSAPIRLSPIGRARNHIGRHFADPGLKVASVARAVGSSLSRLHELARMEGTTLGAMILETRLEASARALSSAAHAHRSITEIAMDCGFASPAHFSRAFRQHYGASPREFRRDGGVQPKNLS